MGWSSGYSGCVGGMAGAVAGVLAGVTVLDGTLPDCNAADVLILYLCMHEHSEHRANKSTLTKLILILAKFSFIIFSTTVSPSTKEGNS